MTAPTSKALITLQESKDRKKFSKYPSPRKLPLVFQQLTTTYRVAESVSLFNPCDEGLLRLFNDK